MIPFTSKRINYSAINEADNKAERERQLQLKVNDEKRRKMNTEILTLNYWPFNAIGGPDFIRNALLDDKLKGVEPRNAWLLLIPLLLPLPLTLLLLFLLL
jgi:hypothetical protein